MREKTRKKEKGGNRTSRGGGEKGKSRTGDLWPKKEHMCAKKTLTSRSGAKRKKKTGRYKHAARVDGQEKMAIQGVISAGGHRHDIVPSKKKKRQASRKGAKKRTRKTPPRSVAA